MRTIVVDSQAIGHAAKHMFKTLSFQGRQTGVIFGFLSQVLSISRKLKITEFLFAWDSRDSFRKKVYPDYKKREHLKDISKEDKEINQNAFQQFYELRSEVLPSMGFQNNFIQRGYEADDIIASIVLNNSGSFVVASEDKDLYQLLDHCSLWKIRTKRIYAKENFLLEYGITPEDWKKVKTYAGCKGDEVPSIPGIGETSVIKYIKGILKGTRFHKIVTADKALLEKNQKLTTLPFEGVQSFPKRKDEITLDKIFKTCEDLGLYSLLNESNVKVWRTFCD